MTIPTYDTLMLPVLRLSGEQIWSMRELIGRISDDLGLTERGRAETIPSGTKSLIASRVHWAKTYLKQAGLVEQPQRGMVQISAAGRKVLARSVQHPRGANFGRISGAGRGPARCAPRPCP